MPCPHKKSGRAKRICTVDFELKCLIWELQWDKLTRIEQFHTHRPTKSFLGAPMYIWYLNLTFILNTAHALYLRNNPLSVRVVTVDVKFLSENCLLLYNTTKYAQCQWMPKLPLLTTPTETLNWTSRTCFCYIVYSQSTKSGRDAKKATHFIF